MIDWSVSLILVDAAGVMLDAAGAMVDPAAMVDPTGVAVWLHPTQAISIAVTRIMRLSRCMRKSPGRGCRVVR
jgi:hypothetical protein